MITQVTSMFFFSEKWGDKCTFRNVISIFRRADLPQFAFFPMFAPQHSTWLICMTIWKPTWRPSWIRAIIKLYLLIRFSRLNADKLYMYEFKLPKYFHLGKGYAKNRGEKYCASFEKSWIISWQPRWWNKLLFATAATAFWVSSPFNSTVILFCQVCSI